MAETLELYDEQALQGESLASITQAVLAHLQAQTRQWWLHVDLDVLSTEALSAIDYPQPGGLSWRQLERLSATAMVAHGLIGWDVTIYNPDLDPDGSQARRIVEYLLNATAHIFVHKVSASNSVNGTLNFLFRGMGKDEEPEQGFRPRLLALIEIGTVALLLRVKAVCCPTFDWYSSEVA